MPPTVITGLTDSSRCMQEEIFGPVVCIAKFAGDDEGNAFFSKSLFKNTRREIFISLYLIWFKELMFK